MRGAALIRLHLFEFNDQPWFPASWRACGLAYLAKLSDWIGAADAMAPFLQRVVGDRIVDLCSGQRGPAVRLGELLNVPVTLTDKFPDRATFGRLESDRVQVRTDSVDALAVPAELTGTRTMFNALHHFRPDEVRAVLGDAATAGQPIAIFELSERTFVNLNSAPLIIPILVALTVPTLRPFRWDWIVFTYLIPILPLVIAWDGWVSHWRTYTPHELRGLTPQVEGYTWTIEQSQLGPGKMTVLLGAPSGQYM